MILLDYRITQGKMNRFCMKIFFLLTEKLVVLVAMRYQA